MARIGLLAVALSVTALFVGLGVWQLDRAEQKRAAVAQFVLRSSAPLVDLNERVFDDGSELSGYRVSAAGTYRGTTILLDNQVHNGRVGYLVYGALALNARNQSVLVNRGWLGAGPDRGRSPEVITPTGSQHLEGRLSLPPQGGLRLEGSEVIEPFGHGTWRVQAIDFGALSAVIGAELLPVTVVLLGDDAMNGFERDWAAPGSARGAPSGESRHLGYAFQWFALALTVVVVAGVLTLRARKSPTDNPGP
ncbi:MAG: SURF1 family protein [Gammaproteobacteria bacterium]|nr:SURF1 family protein [Gammaproteobacteria bacterium]